MLARAVAAVWILFGAAVAAPVAAAADKVIQVPGNDPEMTEAIARARASLPEFWAAYREKPAGTDSFAIKVRIPYSEKRAEHFWLTEIESDGTQHSGIISNDPNNATHVTKGQRYTFTDAEITDWLFHRNGKMVGNETMRPLLKRMPADRAAHFRKMYEKQ
jgi:uncharacterized protein YegJ (DUF2314 family)